jgi:hypothetical protein
MGPASFFYPPPLKGGLIIMTEVPFRGFRGFLKRKRLPETDSLLFL